MGCRQSSTKPLTTTSTAGGSTGVHQRFIKSNHNNSSHGSSTNQYNQAVTGGGKNTPQPPATRKRTDSWASPPPFMNGASSTLVGPPDDDTNAGPATAALAAATAANATTVAATTNSISSLRDEEGADPSHSFGATVTTTTNTPPRTLGGPRSDRQISTTASPSRSIANDPTMRRLSEDSTQKLLEAQWKFLWDTHAQQLVDPVDVPAVVDALLNRAVNRLSDVQVTWLLRSIRSVVASLPSMAQTQSKLAKIVLSGNNTNNVVVEARLVAERYHVLHPVVWQRVLPVSHWVPSTGTNTRTLTRRDSSGNNLLQLILGEDRPGWAVLALQNLELMLLHLSHPDWDRVALAAQNATQEIEMDVNRRDFASLMPKPSSVPDIVEPVTAPMGVTVQALAAIIGLAAAGSRAQRLQLLFYLLYDNFRQFLEYHPAGGVPVWLLEVDAGVVVSLASLTHYHYYGTAFLPCPVEARPSFRASKSREPLKISAKLLHQMVESLLNEPPESLKASQSSQEIMSADGERRSLPSSWHQRLSLATDGRELYHGKEWETARARFQNHCATNNEIDDLISLELYLSWADKALDDFGLDIIMHRLFAAGILTTAALEKEWVGRVWEDWYQQQDRQLEQNVAATTVQQVLSADQVPRGPPFNTSNYVWGGLGGIDGGAGIGYGILYCIDKKWWDTWVDFVGWSWIGDRPSKRKSIRRPGALSSESLLEQETVIPGSLGSYYVMKQGLIKHCDYVLIPPGVWNVLFEIYSGGPPLPRMILPLERKFSDSYRDTNDSISRNGDNGEITEGHEVDLDAFVEQLGLNAGGRVMRLPDSVSVCTHPWIIHCQLCDPVQPYRRGDAGLASIRLMVTPDEALWRLFAESVTRFSLQGFKAFDSDGRGMARLWKRSDAANSKGPISRYGPWNLLCKSRHAEIPLMIGDSLAADVQSYFIQNWKAYTDNATTESILLADQDRLMFEFAVLSKSGDLIWPREAAAKAGRVRRLVEEEAEFRRTLQAVDEEGNMMLRPPNLIGMNVDAMDITGRWYPVTILEVDFVDLESTDEEEVESDSPSDPAGRTSKKVKVDFSEFGGHMEWIDVDSDRLGPPGRFTNDADQQSNPSPSNGAMNGSATETKKGVAGAMTKKNASANGESGEIAKLCSVPGFGGCGLTNLGNTCYMNSALQCISYLPLLRAYLLSNQYKSKGDLNKDNPLGSGGKFLEESADLLRVMWSARLGEKSPTRFKTQLGKINSQFSGADQQDAQELLNYMLDVLHEDSNRVRKKPYVEALEDDWVKKHSLPRVGDEAWRRFLRRNRSIMADVAMGQVLNTVTCPICNYASRNFDPFNLLSIPIPTVADVIFQCTLIRRATAWNCPWVLNKPRTGSSWSVRFSRKTPLPASGPPSEIYVAEEYVITMSRLADSGDLRLQLQNLSGIPANYLQLYRFEDFDNSQVGILEHQVRLTPLNEKDGPCSQLVRKRLPNEDGPLPPTPVVAFENTLRARQNKDKGDRADEDVVGDDADTNSQKETAAITRLMEQYGDEKECRIVDSDPLILSKAISRRLWPKVESDMFVGLRVDAKDRRGNWFAGSVVNVYDESINGGDADSGEEVQLKCRKVCVHFDNFSSKWDETYTIENFQEGTVMPLYSHAATRLKPIGFLINHKFRDAATNFSVNFGQPFVLQCRNEWTNARAGAHILAQASRFLQYVPPIKRSNSASDPYSLRESKRDRLYEKTNSIISDFIDMLIDFDREYMRFCLGFADANQPLSPDASDMFSSLAKQVDELSPRLPFEIRVCSMDPIHAEKEQLTVEEDIFPLILHRTVGNFLNAKNVIVLLWRDPPREKTGSSYTSSRNPVMYLNPPIQIHQAGAEILKQNDAMKEDDKSKKSKLGSAGIDLGVCLTEFCKVQKLSLTDSWRCPRCKEFREGKQDMNLWRLPDLLTFHIKRFNMSARWREKISTRVNFPLTGLDMREWCHKESPVSTVNHYDSHVYDLIGVMNHFGSMTGGHYVATCRATSCGREGREEISHVFSGIGVSGAQLEELETPSGWRIGRPKAEVNQNKVAAAMWSKAVAESSEPMWLQFDDELVEPIPPDQVVSEMAYVLFYRRRQITPSNIARYSTLE